MDSSSTAITMVTSLVLVLFVLVELESSEMGPELRLDINLNMTPYCSETLFCKDRRETSIYHGCQCDQQCSIYEDCCRDSPYFVPTDIPKLNFTCVQVPTAYKKSEPMKMIASCPPEASPEEHTLCGTRNETKYLFSLVPITITEKNVSVIYRNVYCARCNIHSNATYDLWNTTLVCDGAPRNSKPFPEHAEASWDSTKKRWLYKEMNKTLACDMKIIEPNLNSIRYHITCHSGFVDQCPNGTDPEVAKLCRGYTAVVTTRTPREMYKNPHCFRCNGGVQNNFRCGTPPVFIPRSGFTRVTGDASKYSVLLRYVRSECAPGEHYDEILKECVHLFPPRALHHDEDAAVIDTCARAKLSALYYELSPDNATVIVPKYERNFTQGQFRLTEAGELEICEKDVPPLPTTIYSFLIAVVTLVGFGLSIIFLVLHLCAVCLVAELRNLSGITLASLCLALLGGYISFLVGIHLRDQPYLWCYTCAIVTYYFFMASFFWMLVLAFDVSKVLRASVKKFRAAHGFHRLRFAVYSIIAWGTPFLATIATHWADARDTDCIWLKPMLGLHGCWFGNTQSHIVFFVAPLAVIMLLNFSFFVYAAWVTSDSSTRRNLKVYVKLTILLGLNWIGGLLAMVLDSDFLWVLFSILNTFQGLFIFLSFTMTSKVSKGLSKFLPCLDNSAKEKTPQNTTDKETSFTSKSPQHSIKKEARS